MIQSNDDELKARRQIDLENLNKIPEIHKSVEFICDTMKEIKTKIEDYPETKTKVNMLVNWHWKIVGAVIVSGVGLIVTVLVILIKR